MDFSYGHTSAGCRTAVTQWTVRSMLRNDLRPLLRLGAAEQSLCVAGTPPPPLPPPISLILKFCCSIVPSWVKILYVCFKVVLFYFIFFGMPVKYRDLVMGLLAMQIFLNDN